MSRQQDINKIANKVLQTFDAAFAREVDRHEETRATMAEICGTALALAISEIPEGFTGHEVLAITVASRRKPGQVEENLNRILQRQALREAAERDKGESLKASDSEQEGSA